MKYSCCYFIILGCFTIILWQLYIIFRTNLLTQCLVPVAIFCLFFTSQEINIKRSPNTAKLFVDFLWTRRLPMGQSSTWGCPEGGTTHQGAPGGPGAPRWVPTSVASRTPSLPYKFPKNLDQKFHCRRPL